jgi:hypothetical protein
VTVSIPHRERDVVIEDCRAKPREVRVAVRLE